MDATKTQTKRTVNMDHSYEVSTVFATLRRSFDPQHMNPGYQAMRDALLHGLPLLDTLWREIQSASLVRDDASLRGALEFLMHCIERFEEAGGTAKFASDQAPYMTKTMAMPGEARRSHLALTPHSEANESMAMLCEIVETLNRKMGGFQFTDGEWTRKARVINRTESASVPTNGKPQSGQIRHGGRVTN